METFEIVIDGLRLAGDRYPGSGMPIVLLHGYLETRRVFGPFVDGHLSGREVVAFDIPCHGQSDTLGPAATVDRAADLLCRALERLGARRYAVYGHSMGGYVALAMALRAPGAVALAGLLHSNVYADTDAKRADRAREARLVMEGALPAIAGGFMPRMVAPCNREALAPELAGWARAAAAMPPAHVAHALAMLASRPPREAMLGGSVPLHLIAGDQDPFLPLDAARAMAKGPAVRFFTLIPECGHASFVERPAPAARAITEAVDAVAGAGEGK